MVINYNKSSFVEIYYAKKKSNGETELVPVKLYVDGEHEHTNSSPVTRAGTEIPIGTLLGNRYLIKRFLGQGGFGRTYLAIDQHSFNELCVIKEFVPSSIGEYEGQKYRDLFTREAKILRQIEHPQIPSFLAYFEEKGRLFLVQEYVAGQTYSTLLGERISQQRKAFTEAEIIQLLRNLLPVLDYIHTQDIIHRDISPDNIILTSDTNLPVLIDFGVGKQRIENRLTDPSNFSNSERAYARQKSVVGKIGYAPHEQICMGQSFPSSDLYALGVTTIVLLTGKQPDSLMDQHSLEWQWRSYVRVSKHLAQIIDKMLADKPKDRYQSAKDVLAALDRPKSPEVTVLSQAPQGRVLHQPPKTTAPETKQGTPLHPAFIEYCQEELTEYIGPIASVLLRKIVSKHPDLSPQMLIETLAKQIPNPQKAIEFRQRLLE